MNYTTPSGGEIGELSYGYDSDGRVSELSGSLAHLTVPSTGPTATFDADDRLVARGELTNVSGSGLTAAFGYDADGRRSSSTINGATTNYLYDGANLIQASASGTPTVNRLTGGLDQTLEYTDPTGTFAPITDQLGSTVGLVGSDGTVATSYSYDPYGAPSSTGDASPNTQQFAGTEYDSATGLYYEQARFYSPSLGRFISTDPMGLGGGSSNLYQYGLGDPTNFADPSGDCPFCLVLLGKCVLGGAINVGIGGELSHLTGRKYTLKDGLEDFGVGCLTTGATEGISAGFRALSASVDAGDDLALQGARSVAGDASGGGVDAGIDAAGDGVGGATDGVSSGGDGSGGMEGSGPVGCNSFDPDTPVLMADGTTKPIKDVKVGDRVASTDPKTGAKRSEPVNELHDDQDSQLTDVSVHTRDGRTQVIHTTQHHPFWDASAGSWVDAASLKQGDRLLSTGDQVVTVAGVRSWTGSHDMRNLTVQDLHTYFVVTGTAPVLVHNTACVTMTSVVGDDPFLAKAARDAGRNQRVQQEMDSLFLQLSQGNMNPGIGTKSLSGTDIFYARGRNGARLFFRNVDGGIQIVAKADKDNESAVIARLLQLYG
jgi:RHS repeat-associated protein